MEMWTVYNSPDDAPGRFIARKFLIGVNVEPEATNVAVMGATLNEVRAKLPLGLVCIARSPDDLPSVVESWL